MDGSHSGDVGGKGKIAVELNIRDIDILEKLSNCFDCKSSIYKRVRKTNFSDRAETATLSVFSQEFRRFFAKYKPVGKQREFAIIPSDCIERDYIRGLYDADGSMGFQKDGTPFVSIIVVEENLKEYLCSKINEITGVIKIISRNKRDNVYNIVIKNEECVSFLNYMYKEANIFSDRKFKIYQEILQWRRKEGVIKVKSQTWTKEEDNLILNNPLNECMSLLNRTDKSIKTRLWRLKNKLIK